MFVVFILLLILKVLETILKLGYVLLDRRRNLRMGRFDKSLEPVFLLLYHRGIPGIDPT